MLIRIVKMTFREDAVPAFRSLFEANKTAIRNFDGCRHLELLQQMDEPGVFFTYSYWESPEKLNAYRNSGLFAAVWADTKVLFDAKPEAWSVARVDQVLV